MALTDTNPQLAAEAREALITPHASPDGDVAGSLGEFVGRPSIRGRRHMVAAMHYLATMGGLRVLERGGNAVDAGVAAGICLNVVAPQEAMFGGVAPIIVSLNRPAGRQVVVISGLGRWPKAARLEDYLARYGGDLPAGLPRTVTPAAPDAWLTALAEFGTMRLEEVLQPALELAGEGFPMWHQLRDHIAGAAQPGGASTRWPSTAAAFLPDGQVPAIGAIFRQPDLARTFRRLIDAEAGATGDRRARIYAARDLFYRGEIAREIATFHQEQGGLLTEADLAAFRVGIEPPVSTTYRGYEVFSCGPWCQGPSLLMALNLLEGYDLPAMGRDSAAYLHTVLEAMKLAFSDRHHYFGDPDFVRVPLAGLLSKEYAAARREHIRPDVAWPEMPPPGDPWGYEPDGRSGAGATIAGPSGQPGTIEHDTRYVCVVDAEGNGFSATPSDGVFGSPVVPGLGIAISTRGTQTWLDPKHPSSLQPWKRPRLTPNPALAHKGGRLYMTFGCPGGDAQVQGMLQTFLNVVDFGLEVQAAIEAPRVMTASHPNSFWPHSYHPGRADVETRIPEPVRAQLASFGHQIRAERPWGAGGFSSVSAIVVDPDSGTLVGGSDPRGIGYAAGW
jgi:gamma-glutamyltranspeptidase / glutathione hydrolase